MKCPQCHNSEISHSPKPWLDTLRSWIRSPKYYCLTCHAKWRAYPRARSQSGGVFLLAILVSLIVVVLFDHMASNWSLSSNRSKSKLIEIMKDPVLAGKLMKAQSDPSALKNLTSTERGKLSAMKKSILNSRDSGGMGMLTQLVGDSSLAEKIMRAKGDPKSLRNLSASEKEKLKQIKNSLSTSQIQNLKREYGQN
jgi:hypothetical protein